MNVTLGDQEWLLYFYYIPVQAANDHGGALFGQMSAFFWAKIHSLIAPVRRVLRTYDELVKPRPPWILGLYFRLSPGML